MTKDILSDETIENFKGYFYGPPDKVCWTNSAMRSALNTIEHYKAELEAKDAQIQVLVEAVQNRIADIKEDIHDTPQGCASQIGLKEELAIYEKALATTPAKALEIRRAEQAVIEAVGKWHSDGLNGKAQKEIWTLSEALQALKEK